MSPQSLENIGELSAPISVFLNLTRRCNMRCIYCSAEAIRPSRSRNDELTDGEMLRLVEELVEARVFRYNLTGGEVFLRRELLFQILDRTAECGFVKILTNATLIREDDARRLGTYDHPPAVAVSIDAPVEEINAATRGRGFLAKTLRGAERLRDQGIHPAVNCVVSKSNFRWIGALVDFLKERGFHRLRIEVRREIVERMTCETGLQIAAGDDKAWVDLRANVCRLQEAGDCNRPSAKLLPCSAAVDQCMITAEGWVTPCNLMPSYRCGNIRRQEFLSIWRESPRLKTIRALRRTPVAAIRECSDCDYKIVCRGGCRALGLAHGGDLLGWDPSCPYRAPARAPTSVSALPVVA
jgi:radical SAM protein with 4Fe4S-binding SPASM domain